MTRVSLAWLLGNVEQDWPRLLHAQTKSPSHPHPTDGTPSHLLQLFWQHGCYTRWVHTPFFYNQQDHAKPSLCSCNNQSMHSVMLLLPFDSKGRRTCSHLGQEKPFICILCWLSVSSSIARLKLTENQKPPIVPQIMTWSWKQPSLNQIVIVVVAGSCGLIF